MRRSAPEDDHDPPQLGFTFAAPEPLAPTDLPEAIPVRKVWSVKELVSIIRGRIERDFSEVWFEGEMSNYRPAHSGHMYFTIKDDDAQISVVMFRTSARLLRFKPDNGMHLIGRGKVTIYDQRGQLQINAEYLEPKGAGALQVAFEQLKAKLAAEGLFDADRKRPIPKLPRTVGIITSPSPISSPTSAPPPRPPPPNSSSKPSTSSSPPSRDSLTASATRCATASCSASKTSSASAPMLPSNASATPCSAANNASTNSTTASSTPNAHACSRFPKSQISLPKPYPPCRPSRTSRSPTSNHAPS